MLLFFDGFDAQDFANRWSTGNSPAASGTTPWGAGASVQINVGGGGNSIARSFTASAPVIIGCQLRQGGLTGFSMMRLYGDNGATQHCSIITNSNGTSAVVRADGTVLFTGSTVIAANNFYFFEIKYTVHPTAGYAELRINGVVQGTFTGNTKNGGTNNSIDRVHFTSSNFDGNYWIDDVYVADNNGSRNNDFLGMVRVQTLLPNGAGSSTQFTPTSGANYTTVNDVPDNTATYNSDTVAGHRDTYAMGDVGAATGTVFAVAQTMHARQLDAGTATIKQAQKSGATVSYGATRTLGATMAAYTDLFETNPASGSPYTVAEVNALEAGAEIV